MTEMTRTTVPLRIKTVGDRQVETIASTGSLDRESDRILPTAWTLDTYRRNPVVLWSHDHRLPPIARSLDVRVVGGALRTVDEFPPVGVYPLADQVCALVKAGFITSKSVGFKPLAWQPNAEGGKNFTEVELLEHSYVALPANPDAVVSAKAKGVRDPAALDRFFGTPRGGALRPGVNDGDQLITIDAQTVAAALREVWGVPSADDPVLVLADDRPDDVERFVVDPAVFHAAMAEAVGAMVGREVRAAINHLRGRVD